MASAIAGVGAVSAADMAVKAPPMAVDPTYNWSGWYAGANAGGSFGERAYVSAVPTFAAPSFATEAATSALLATNPGNGNSFLGGLQVGYNLQVAPKYVFGLEADIQGATSSRQTVASVVPLFPNETIFSNANSAPTYLGTVRGRFGVLVSPALLLYGTGGFAYGGRGSISQNDIDSTNQCLVAGTFCHPYGSSFGTQYGYTLGVGGEWMVKSNWSVKAEYLFYSLGGGSSATLTNNFLTSSAGFVAGSPAWSSALQAGRLQGNIVRLGVNYHFAAPVVAKY
jgi:outer membrane immunogenic protein